MQNQKLMPKAVFIITLFCAIANQALAQNVDQIRWKNEAQVRSILGDPQSTTSPVGTHASYTMWRYENYTVAFSNGKAFHLFGQDSLRKNRLQDSNKQQN